MDKAEILDFLNANPSCHLATVEGNKPRVRGMLIHRADENGIIIETATFKDVYKQLSANPNVELCFNNYQQGIQVRVSGKAETVEDIETIRNVVDNRPYL